MRILSVVFFFLTIYCCFSCNIYKDPKRCGKPESETTKSDSRRSQQRKKHLKEETSSSLDVLIPNRYQGCECGGDHGGDRRSWMARVAVRTGPSKEATCGAVIVNKLFLLSAANCFCDLLLDCGMQNVGQKKVVDNIAKGPDKPMVTVQIGSRLGSKPLVPTKFAVERVIIHENYYQVRDGPTGPNNLALLRLAEPLQLVKGTAWPICLPPNKPKDNDDKLSSVNDLDCDFHQGEGQAAVAGGPECPLRDSFTTGWDLQGETDPFRSGTDAEGQADSQRCRTNQYGPMAFKECLGSCRKYPDPPPSDDRCYDRSGSSILTGKSLPGFMKGQTRVVMIIEGNEWYYCIPAENRRREADFRGWCESCTIATMGADKCREAGRMSWGFCLPECSKRSEGMSRPGGGGVLREVATSAFNDNPRSNLSCPANGDFEFCTGEAMFSPLMQVYWRFENGSYSPKVRLPTTKFEPRHVKAKSCLGEAGGSVWKRGVFGGEHQNGGGEAAFGQQEGGRKNLPAARELAFLTGIISRPEDTCGFFGLNENPQRVLNTRIGQYTDWITDRIYDGVCYQTETADEDDA